MLPEDVHASESTMVSVNDLKLAVSGDSLSIDSINSYNPSALDCCPKHKMPNARDIYKKYLSNTGDSIIYVRISVARS